jgi:hypothetical protein
MRSIPINFAKNSYQTRGVKNSSQRLLNLYAEINPEDNKTPICLYGTPGFKLKYDLEIDNAVYGLQQMGNDLFAVCGNDVFNITTGGVITNIGTLTGIPGRVIMSNNGLQLFILDINGNGWIVSYNSGTSLWELNKITDAAYQLSSSVCFLDGYFILSKQSSGQFFISKLGDGTSYDALDFATAEWEPDNLISVFSFNGQIVLFGTQTIEFYQDTGSSAFPFQRINGASVEKGCSSRGSIAKNANNLLFLGNDRIVYQLNGYQLSKISTFPIEKEIERYTKNAIENCFSFIYIQDGHITYILSFPDANKTWCYDLTTGLWHERGSVDIDKYTMLSWNANSYEYFNSLNLVGDKNLGKIYELDLDTFSENGTPIISEATSTTLFNNTKRTVIHKFQLDIESGQGISNGQGINPKLMMQFSKDGGFTYSSQLRRDIGAKGKYKTRAIWRNIGISGEIVFKISISDPVKRVLYQPFIDIEECEQ